MARADPPPLCVWLTACTLAIVLLYLSHLRSSWHSGVGRDERDSGASVDDPTPGHHHHRPDSGVEANVVRTLQQLDNTTDVRLQRLLRHSDNNASYVQPKRKKKGSAKRRNILMVIIGMFAMPFACRG